ncbi:MAG: TetR/AcrR family transcriptional regulator, partial [Hyphomonadaceae bacterium]
MSAPKPNSTTRTKSAARARTHAPQEEAKPRRRATTKVQQRADKMEQILDAAEHLFTRHGLYGVTLKDVAGRVGAHHTLLNYYFTDQKKL